MIPRNSISAAASCLSSYDALKQLIAAEERGERGNSSRPVAAFSLSFSSSFYVSPKPGGTDDVFHYSSACKYTYYCKYDPPEYTAAVHIAARCALYFLSSVRNLPYFL